MKDSKAERAGSGILQQKLQQKQKEKQQQKYISAREQRIAPDKEVYFV